MLLLPHELVERTRPEDAIETLFFPEHAAASQARRHGLAVGGNI